MTPHTVPASSQAVRSGRLWTVPNALSALRLPLAAAFLLFESVPVRAAIVTVVALSDALDGWIARRVGQMSATGAFLDAVSDKLFAFVALGTFLLEGRLGPVSFLVLISRDLYIGFAFLGSRLARASVPVRARAGGKIVTVLQIGTLFLLLFAPGWVGPAVVAVGLVSAYAIADYTWAGWRALRSAT